jgi:hypothetical protein
LLTVTFAAMLLTAKIFSKSEAKHERQPKQLPAAIPPLAPAGNAEPALAGKH